MTPTKHPHHTSQHYRLGIPLSSDKLQPRSEKLVISGLACFQYILSISSNTAKTTDILTKTTAICPRILPFFRRLRGLRRTITCRNRLFTPNRRKRFTGGRIGRLRSYRDPTSHYHCPPPFYRPGHRSRGHRRILYRCHCRCLYRRRWGGHEGGG